MTLPEDKRKGSPRERFRSILAADHDDEPTREPRKPAVVNLPTIADADRQAGTAGSGSVVAGSPRPDVAAGSRLMRTFWTIGGILSVLANAVLVSMLLGDRSLASGDGAAEPLLGVYQALVQLDNAQITATIPIETIIAPEATAPINASTRITLARDLFVRGAHVTINSSGLSIDSPADITLPAGTEMDVNLDLALLMESGLPLRASFPLDMAIRDTEPHAALLAMQDALRPLICGSLPGARLSDGTPICR